MLGWKVTKVRKCLEERTRRPRYEVTLVNTRDSCYATEEPGRAKAKTEIKVFTTVVVDASGIGSPDYSSVSSYKNERGESRGLREVALEMIRAKLVEITKKGAESLPRAVRPFLLPRILHSQDLYKILTLLADPVSLYAPFGTLPARDLLNINSRKQYQPFVGKTVVMIGTGDSSRTILEFLFRVNQVQEAFGTGSNQTGIVGRVFWCGNSVSTNRDAYKKSDEERPR